MKKSRGLQILAGLSLGSLIAPLAMAQDPDIFDVVFLSDTTGSMGVLINSAQDSSNAIQTAFLSRGDVRFGVGEYKDGNADAFGFRYNLEDEGTPILSNDTAAVSGAIGAWGASGGGDFPEDGLSGLREVASTAPWREGSRRIIFWFGDDTSLDPGSDGTTMATALAALNEECVQVVAVDLNRLDGLGQATEITETVLDCGLIGGLYREVTIEEIEEEIDGILLGLFDEVIIETPSGGGELENPSVASTVRLIGITMSNTISRDVGGRLSRLRAGGSGALSVTQTPSTLASGGKAVIPGHTVVGNRFSVWGDIYAFSQDIDGQNIGATLSTVLRTPDTELDIFGGTVGVDYRLDSNWTIGLGVGAANGEADLDGVGDIDIDSVAIMPYVSFYKEDVIQGADFYADLMYAYTDSDYEANGASASGDSSLIELNVGLNYNAGSLIHGPYAQIRSLDGDIDNVVDFESLATQLGYQVSRPMPYGNGTLIPQVRVAWEHEFEADNGSIGGISLGELDEDIFIGGIVVNYLLDSGVNLGLDYQARLGEISESHYVGLNAGFKF